MNISERYSTHFGRTLPLIQVYITHAIPTVTGQTPVVLTFLKILLFLFDCVKTFWIFVALTHNYHALHQRPALLAVCELPLVSHYTTAAEPRLLIGQTTCQSIWILLPAF